MTLSDRPAERHREIAGAFTARVLGTRDWDAPAPVEGWLAHDVVRAAWGVHSAAVKELLDDPATSGATLRNPHIGELPLDRAVDQFYTADVFMHTWDLARATGQNERLDQDFCAVLLGGMESMEQVIRASGQYGARVPVPDGADPQTRLLGFIGRRPLG